MLRLPQMPKSVTHVLGKSVTYVSGRTFWPTNRFPAPTAIRALFEPPTDNKPVRQLGLAKLDADAPRDGGPSEAKDERRSREQSVPGNQFKGFLKTLVGHPGNAF